MFKVGDRVWSFEFGWGVVESLKFTKDYPVLVSFESDRNNRYTSDGRLYAEVNRSLFFEEFSPPESALKRPRWRAGYKENYLYIGATGEINELSDFGHGFDNSLYKTGNYFKSATEAKESKFYKVFHEEE